MRERLGYSEVHTLPLNTTLTEVLVTIQGKEFVCYPSPIKSHPNTCTSKKYCLFHKDRGHDIEDCYIQKKEIESLKVKGYFSQFLKKDSHLKHNRKEPGQFIIVVPEINLILKGTSFRGDSNNGKRKYRKKVLIAIKLLDQ